ncbi:MAG: A/G-specific adenine glycosylase [Aureispira sp.]
MKEISSAEKLFFTRELLAWYQPSDRPLPWKAIKNPYFIWLSEIILQQTRVEQGMPYYLKFVQKYPTVVDLANAPEDDIFKLWEGLGYYSRARNLQAAAKRVVELHEGVFPTTYKDIRALKGVGEYTAAAIASFAYDLPYAVVDGNVYRVLSRFFGIATPIDSTAGKKEFRKLADELLPEDKAAVYNQAIMDFGATICMPKKPLCNICPLQSRCEAWYTQTIGELPVKAKKIKKRPRYFYYLIINHGEQVYVRKRPEGDIWAGLYDFPLIELDQLVEGMFLTAPLSETAFWQVNIAPKPLQIQQVSPVYKQVLSHQHIHALFIEMHVTSEYFMENPDFLAIERKKIKNFAFPKLIGRYLDQ